jgi:hypothetical protein
MSGAKDDPINIHVNFKVSPIVEKAIADGASELGLTISAYLRLCVYIADPLLQTQPALKEQNRQALRNLMEYIGNTLVIQPARFRLEGGRDG